MPRPNLLPLLIISMLCSSALLTFALGQESVLAEESGFDAVSGRQVTSLSLSSQDAVPGYPLTVTFDATGINVLDTWFDPYMQFGSGIGVFDCGEGMENGEIPHIIPLDWAEDGDTDCENGHDELTGSGDVSSASATYRVWAISNTGEEYMIASQRPTINGMVEVTWNIPNIQPTGTYSICADQTNGAVSWSLDTWGSNPWDKEDRYLVEDSGIWSTWSSELCTSLEINLYSLTLSGEIAEGGASGVVLPGSEVHVSGIVTNPVDGAPSQPATLETLVEYWTEDVDGNLMLQSQILNINPPASTFVFSFLTPSNLYNGSSHTYSRILVNVWANSSTGNQVEFAYASFWTGSMMVDFITPAPTQLVIFNEPFLVQAQAITIANYGGEDAPVANKAFNLKLIVGTSIFDLATGIRTDDQGYLMHVSDLSNYAFTGPAWLRLEWVDQSTMAPAHLDRQIYLSESADAIQQVGVGINLNIEEQNMAPQLSGIGELGDTFTVTISAEDDWGNPIEDVWLHWCVKTDTNVELDNHPTSSDTIYQVSPWSFAQTDADGFAEIEITLSPSINVNEGEVSIHVIGYNSTGSIDQITIQVPLIQPVLDIDSEDGYYVPGENVTYTINSTGMEGDIVYFWSTSDGNDGYIETTSSLADGEQLTIQIPLYWDYGYYSLSVMGVSDSGIATSWHTLNELSGYGISLSTDSNSYLPGEMITIDYTVSPLNPRENIVFPLEWSAEIIGQHDSEISGFATAENNTFMMQIPDDIQNGQYLIILSIGSEETIAIITIHSDTYSVSIETPHDAPTAGDAVNIQYNIKSLKENQDIELPLEWSALITGYPDSRANGSVSSTSGNFVISLPSDMVTGSHLLEISIGGQTTTTVMEVRSQDDGTGISGAVSATNDVLDSATPLLAIFALIFSLAALMMNLFKGRSSDDEGFKSAYTEAAKIELPPPAVAAPAPIPAGDFPPGLSPGPPPPGMNGIVKEDGYEWLEHGGSIWYRAAHSGSQWTPWRG